MSKIKKALDVVTDLRNLADSIEGLVEVIETNQTESGESPAKNKDTPKVSKAKEKKEVEENKPTLEEVRAVLASLSQAGKQAQVKSLITSFDAKKLSDIPNTQYSDLLKKASEL